VRYGEKGKIRASLSGSPAINGDFHCGHEHDQEELKFKIRIFKFEISW
jgi:hypothetical protein